ncbi:MAG: hypothetical protein PWQ15_351 [Methanobacterium sp.]|jgi:hemerythrin-like domain-containing protein|uniref:hemerythrin domain-containing protein n=1 Tax=Methanobacterium sp. TaxID=2164 RepID=UPI0003C9B4CF|nr:hemerythrin domain-containing protein [Methanobacterium sp.]MDI3549249.1 hypothetical protein [Methanobacterium sp.]CDG65408.1 hypothetical protein MBMB1_1310 [Methanobacterium sp. MB1]
MVENIYDLLKMEHERVKKLFKKTIDQRSATTFANIEKELCLHMSNEEKYLYPPLEDADKLTLLEGYEEHNIAKRLVKEIKNEEEASDLWLVKIKVLKEIIEHHIKEEERDIFNIAIQTLSNNEEEKILSQFKEENAKMGI